MSTYRNIKLEKERIKNLPGHQLLQELLIEVRNDAPDTLDNISQYNEYRELLRDEVEKRLK